MLLKPEYLPLHLEMWKSHQWAVKKASRAALDSFDARLEAAQKPGGLQDLAEQPRYVTGAQLLPHQLSGVNWLRRQWVQGSHAMLADDSGMGKTATVITFLSTLL